MHELHVSVVSPEEAYDREWLEPGVDDVAVGARHPEGAERGAVAGKPDRARGELVRGLIVP